VVVALEGQIESLLRERKLSRENGFPGTYSRKLACKQERKFDRGITVVFWSVISAIKDKISFSVYISGPPT
jgi:hypothetical protein